MSVIDFLTSDAGQRLLLLLYSVGLTVLHVQNRTDIAKSGVAATEQVLQVVHSVAAAAGANAGAAAATAVIAPIVQPVGVKANA